MKRNKKLQEERFTIEDELQIVKNKLRDIDPTSTPELLNDIQERLDLISKANKRKDVALDIFFYIVAFLLIATVSLSITQFQGKKYEKELEERLETQLAESAKQDSLFNKYLAVDSSGTYKTVSERGRDLSYKDLYLRKDSLLDVNVTLRDSLSTLTQKLNMAKSNYGIYFTENRVGDHKYITIGSKKIEEMQRSGTESMKKLQPLLDSINKK